MTPATCLPGCPCVVEGIAWHSVDVAASRRPAFHFSLSSAVAAGTEALQLTLPKLVHISLMRNDVIGDSGVHDLAFLKTKPAERLNSELVCSHTEPSFLCVEMMMRAHKALILLMIAT